MKKILLLSLTMIGALCSNAQEDPHLKLIRVEPNGVKVYENVGNEGPSQPKVEAVNTIPEERPLRTWSLDECETALFYIDQKIQMMKETEGNDLEIQKYEALKISVSERRDQLISQK